VIQIVPQIRILVAVEAIDGRKGIDAIAQLCREKLNDYRLKAGRLGLRLKVA
jgi:hypothetical protein